MHTPEPIFENALSAFLAAEGNSLLTDVSERNTCGRLALYLERQLAATEIRGYYADPEYNRKQNGEVKTIIGSDYRIIRITPDLIVHTRGEMLPPKDNLIAIEVKKARSPTDEKRQDRDRLKAMTKPVDEVYGWDGSHPEHVCGYALGVYMEIDIESYVILLEYFKGGRAVRRDQKSINKN